MRPNLVAIHIHGERHRHTDTAIHVRAKPWYTQCFIHYVWNREQTKTPFFTNNREIYRDTCRKTVKLCEEGWSVNPADLLLFRIDTLIRAIYKNSFLCLSLWLVLLITAAFFFSLSFCFPYFEFFHLFSNEWTENARQNLYRVYFCVLHTQIKWKHFLCLMLTTSNINSGMR